MKLSLVLLSLVAAVSAKDLLLRGDRTKPTSDQRALMSKGRDKRKKVQDTTSSDDDKDDAEYFLRAEIATYPGTKVEGDPFVWGQVNLRFNADGSFLTKLNVNGLLPGCTNCGAHVHVGTSCDDFDAPGGHYWNKDALGDQVADDPWNSVGGYNATSQGITTSGSYIDTKLGLEENDGHAVVIHTDGGDRIGCGVLGKVAPDLELESDNIDRYPGYAGPLTPSGSVKVVFANDESMKFSYKMAGLPVDCYKCGVHIHTGVTCDAADQVLGHYWDTSEQADDPWTSASGVYYSTDEDGDAEGFFHLFSGFNYNENIGHAVVFHAQDGSRIGCGTLE